LPNLQQDFSVRNILPIHPSTMTDRLYYHDSFLYDFDAQVNEALDPPRPALILDRTAFYPTSGGQVFDTGSITTAANEKVKVTAVAATDEEILAATRHWAKTEGIFAAPEGAASLVAYRKLLSNGFFRKEDTVVLFNTGSALKYLDVLNTNVERTLPSASSGQALSAKPVPPKPAPRQIGGIIGPY